MAEPDRIKFRCPKCRHVCRVPGSLAGQVGRCPGCKQALQVPGGSEPDQDGEPGFAQVSDAEGAFELVSDSQEPPAPAHEKPAKEKPAKEQPAQEKPAKEEPAPAREPEPPARQASADPPRAGDRGDAPRSQPVRSADVRSRASIAQEPVEPLPGLLKASGILLILTHVGVFIWLAIRAVIGVQNDASLTLLAIHGVGLLACLVFVRIGAGILQQEWSAVAALGVMAFLMAIFALALMPNALETGALTLVGVLLLYGVPVRLAHLHKRCFRDAPEQDAPAPADEDDAAANAERSGS